MVICSVKDEKELHKAVGRIRERGIQCREYREPDRGLQQTAVATEPVYGEQRKLFRKFQLLKPPQLE
jgi:hypothetical protein